MLVKEAFSHSSQVWQVFVFLAFATDTTLCALAAFSKVCKVQNDDITSIIYMHSRWATSEALLESRT